MWWNDSVMLEPRLVMQHFVNYYIELANTTLEWQITFVYGYSDRSNKVLWTDLKCIRVQ